MNDTIKTLRTIRATGRKVLLRCDLGAPCARPLAEDALFCAALPTMRHLLGEGAAVVLCARREDGERESLAPLAPELSALLGCKVAFAADSVGAEAKSKAAALKSGELLLLEDSGFCEGEAENDAAFAAALASLAELFVSDSFRDAHRALASNVGVAAHLPAVAGLGLAAELSGLEAAFTRFRAPLVAVLGGSASEEKLARVEQILPRASSLVIGGELANPFLKAKGARIGRSRWTQEQCERAAYLLEQAKNRGVKVYLPLDSLAANERSLAVKPSLEGASALFDDKIAMDIGPRTLTYFQNVLLRAGAVLWNGPMGVCELPAFSGGTREMARMIAASGAAAVVCGADSAAAVQSCGLSPQFAHSTLCTASAFALLASDPLPAIAPLSPRT